MLGVLLLALSRAGAQTPQTLWDGLPVAEYVTRGMPAPDRWWSGPDLQRAADLLEALATSDPHALPRAGSSVSGRMFAKLVDPEDLHLDPAMPLELRFQDVRIKVEANQRVQTAYLGARTVIDCREELVALMLQGGRAIDALWQQTDATLAKLTADQRAQREAGLMRMRDGTAQVVAGMMVSLGARDTFDTRDRLDLAQELGPLLPALVARCPATSQLETRTQLQGLAQTETDPTLKAALTRLLEALPQ